jgi:predicted metal-dependent peptidase
MRTYIEPSIPTMAVDADCRLYVNEDWVQQRTRDELAYVLLHEVLHVVLSHAKRRVELMPDADENQRLWWNIAADLCIQQMLARQFRHAEPKEGVKIDGNVPGTDVPFLKVPGLTTGMNTEAYYTVLWSFMSQQRQQARRPVSGGTSPSPGEQPDKGQGGGDSDSSPQDQSKGDGKQQGQKGKAKGDSPDNSGQGTLDPSQAGSGSDGHRRDYERPSRMAAQAAVRARLAECEQKIAEMESNGIGTVPGEVRASLKARLHPQPDPFDHLRGVVSRSVASPIGADDYTYRRLRRRQPPNAARLRGVVRYAPECSVIVDTSGSMGGGAIRDRAMTAVAQGLRKVQRPRVICFDAQVRDARRLSSMKDFMWCGGGGTAMDRACEEEDRKHRPDAIVVITDGITPWPAKRLRARLIVALCKPTNHPIPSWAKVVRCYEEGPKYAG